MRYHEGGIVTGPSIPVRIERIGQGADGLCIYSINGGAPEATLTAQQVKELAPLTLERLRQEMCKDEP